MKTVQTSAPVGYRSIMIHKNTHELELHVVGRTGKGGNRRELVEAIEDALRHEGTKVFPGDYLVIILRRDTGRKKKKVQR